MIIKMYATIGSFCITLMGIAWLTGAYPVDNNIVNGWIAIVYGLFGFVYTIVKICKDKKKRGENENKEVVQSDKA